MAWITSRIDLILSAYRRDDYSDPVSFVKQAATILADYSDNIIGYVSDAKTGIQASKSFPPSIAEIKQACDERTTKKARDDHYASLPKFQRADPRPLNRQPNLFVPTDAPRYEKMYAKYEKEPERCRFERGRICQDGIQRDGLWIPLEWWHSDAPPSFAAVEAASRRAFERECQAAGIDPANGVSPSLLNLLKGNDVNAEG